MSYFHQIHHATLNEKGRFVIPAAFRHDTPPNILRGDLRISPMPEGNLIVRPEHVWKTYVESIKHARVAIHVKQRYIRALHATVQRAQLDSQNRLFLAPQMRHALGLQSDHGRVNIVIVGAGNSFEIWESSKYEGDEKLLAEMSKLREEIESTVDTEFFE